MAQMKEEFKSVKDGQKRLETGQEEMKKHMEDKKEEMKKYTEDGQEKFKEETKAEMADYKRSIIKATEEVKIERNLMNADLEEDVEMKTQEVGEELSAARKEIKATQEDLSMNRNSEDLPGNDKQEVSVVNKDSVIHLPEEHKLNVVNRRVVPAKKKLPRKKYKRAKKLKKLQNHRKVRARHFSRSPKQATYPSYPL